MSARPSQSSLFLYEQRLAFNLRIATMPARKRKSLVLAERSEQLVRQLHTCPPGLPDTCLYPPNWIARNPWPRWRTTTQPTYGNYLHSRRWWHDLREAMRSAFLSAWYEQAKPEATTPVMGRNTAIIKGLTA